MTTTTHKRHAHAGSSDSLFSVTSADRLLNIIGEVADNIRAGKTSVSAENMAQTDLVFAFNLIAQYSTELAIQSQTKEKKRLQRRLKSKIMFTQTLAADGGVLSTAEAATTLGKTKTTVNTWRKMAGCSPSIWMGNFTIPFFSLPMTKKSQKTVSSKA